VNISLSQLTKMINGKVIGNDGHNLNLTGTCAIDGYLENKITFARNMKYGEKASKLKNAVILIPQELESLPGMFPQNTYVIVSDLDKTMFDLQDFFYAQSAPDQEMSISPLARIDESAKIGKNVYIGDNAFVGKNAVIGDGAKILPNAFVAENVVIGKNTCLHQLCTCENCVIGDNTIIRTGAHIGVDGFRYSQDFERKKVRKFIHTGMVQIGSRVEIGANTTIQRSTFEGNPTVISDDVKMGCTIVVGHNNKIGARTLITCHVMISGSNVIGEDVWVGACAVFSNGVKVGNRAKVLINAVVVNDVAEDEMVSGFYAMPHKQWKMAYRKLLDFAGNS
jgi:UDP-3-O-[3-hydroxymyristoyl] glucosamine N-acyltransferase